MKNKVQFFFIKVGIIFFLLISNSYTETFEFEAENIETINNDLIKGTLNSLISLTCFSLKGVVQN